MKRQNTQLTKIALFAFVLLCSAHLSTAFLNKNITQDVVTETEIEEEEKHDCGPGWLYIQPEKQCFPKGTIVK